MKVYNIFSLKFLFLFILFGCNMNHIGYIDKFSEEGMEHSVNDFEYANKKRLEIEEKELLERKKREQLVNEEKNRYYAKEFERQSKYYTKEFENKIKRLEEEIEERTRDLKFLIEKGYKKVRVMNVYQFHQDEIRRLTKEKKEGNPGSYSLDYYLQLKDNSIKHHKTYIDAIELRIPNIKDQLIERKKFNIERYEANIERYKSNIERYKNAIKRLHEIEERDLINEKKDLINETSSSKFKTELKKLEYENIIKENENSIENWKEDIEDLNCRIICLGQLRNIKANEEDKLEIKRLENMIIEKELRNKELEEELKKL
ncbi:hypothetical protein [Borrelia miyamotoi]